MAKYYFYIHPYDGRRGPIDAEELKKLAAHGEIAPTTPLEADDGWKGYAEAIPDLVFNSATQYHWQFNFDLHLAICRGCCVIVWIAAIVLGLALSRELYGLFGQDAIGTIIGIWGFCIFSVAFTHLVCSWSLITSKAAQLYVENCEKK